MNTFKIKQIPAIIPGLFFAAISMIICIPYAFYDPYKAKFFTDNTFEALDVIFYSIFIIISCAVIILSGFIIGCVVGTVTNLLMNLFKVSIAIKCE